MKFIKKNTRIQSVCLAIFLSMALVLTTCDDNSTNSNGDGTTDDPSGPLKVEGSLDGYEHGSQDLYQSEDFVDLIEGSISEDGSFTVTFLDMSDIEEALKPLGDDSSDDFVGMYCRETISSTLNSENLFVDVNAFNFTYGENNNVAAIGLSSGEPNLNVFPPQGDSRGEYQTRWIFSSQELSINESCTSADGNSASVEMELSQGWNEVHFDLSEPENKVQFTGERPSDVEWTMN